MDQRLAGTSAARWMNPWVLFASQRGTLVIMLGDEGPRGKIVLGRAASVVLFDFGNIYDSCHFARPCAAWIAGRTAQARQLTLAQLSPCHFGLEKQA